MVLQLIEIVLAGSSGGDGSAWNRRVAAGGGMAVWRESVTCPLAGDAVDMTLRSDVRFQGARTSGGSRHAATCCTPIGRADELCSAERSRNQCPPHQCALRQTTWELDHALSRRRRDPRARCKPQIPLSIRCELSSGCRRC